MAAINGVGGNGPQGPVPNDGVNIGVMKTKLEDPNTTPEQRSEYLKKVLTSMKEDPNPGDFKKTLIDQISQLLDGTISGSQFVALAKTLNTSTENLKV